MKTKKIFNQISKQLLLLVTVVFGLSQIVQAQSCVTSGGVTTCTYSSNGTFTVPEGVTEVTIEAWGGGGAGATRTSNGLGGGGGGGAFAKKTISVIPNDALDLVVGAGGTTNSATQSVVDGKHSTVSFNSNRLIFAHGGKGVRNNIPESGMGGGVYGFASDWYFDGYGVAGLTFQRVVIPESFTVQDMSVYFTAVGSGNSFVIGLFNDNGSTSPGTLIAQSSSTSASVGWNTVTVASHSEQPSGTYWIGVKANNSAVKLGYLNRGGTVNLFGDADPYALYTNSVVAYNSGTLASPVSVSLLNYTSGVYCIYMRVNHLCADTYNTGGHGGYFNTAGSSSGGGGGGAGTTSNGSNAGTAPSAGAGGASDGGDGGAGIGTIGNGSSGSNYGGGGGGARNSNNGGNGASGLIRITYTLPPPVELVFVNQPSPTTCLSTNLSSPPVVEARDAFGALVTNYSGVITLTNAGGIPMTGNSVAAVNGVATFTNLQFTALGNAGLLSTTNVDGLTDDVTSTGVTVGDTQGAPAFVAPGLTPTSITWNWNAVPGATDYEGGFNFGAFASIGISTSHAQSGLSVNTSYSYSVFAYACGNPTVTSTQTVFTAANVPAAPTAVASGYGTINVSVNPNGNPVYTEYAIFCSTTGQWVQADGSLGATPFWQTMADWGTVSVTGLNQNTTYDFQVMAQNQDGVPTALSPIGSATTPCGVNSFPFFDGMETYTGAHASTMTSNNSCYVAGGTGNWNLDNITAYQGVKSAHFNWSSKPWLFIPIYLEAGEIYSFSAYAMTPSGGFGSAFIRASFGTTATPAGMTTSILPETEIPSSGNFIELLQTFTVPADGVYYVGIFGETKTSTSGVRYLDNIKIDRIKCSLPLTPTATAITQTSATLSWTAASPAPADGYEYYVQPWDEDAPVYTTSPTGSVGAGVTTVNLTGLSPNTRYYVWVRSVCNDAADDRSEWVGYETFRTLCGFALIPYYDEFEDGLPIQNCYTQEWVSGIYGWDRYFAPAYISIDAYQKKYVAALYGTGIGTDDDSRWLFVPVRMEGGVAHKFSVYARGSGSIEVRYGTNNNSSAMTTTLVNSVATGSGYGHYTNIFTPPATDNYWVGILGESTGTGTYLIIDTLSITIPDDSSLPVALTHFSGDCSSLASGRLIRWTTASEQNSSHFVVESSIDGVTWTAFETVAAAGNSNQENHYESLDRAVHAGMVYYRLGQVDNDGQTQVYGPIAVTCDEADQFVLYPNPATNQLNILIPAKYTTEDFVVQLFNPEGRIILSQSLNNSFSNKIEMDISAVAKGVYFIQGITNDGVVYTDKLVKE